MVSPNITMASDRKVDRAAGWIWTALVLITLWRIWAAAVLPVTQDEAYYFNWARSLAWGYFDHPPGVALLSLGARLAPSSALAGRIGTVLAATLTLLILLRLYRACGLAGSHLAVAAVIACATLPGLASGVLTTPDTALALGWVLALHEALAALRGERRRWLSAGLATGLGLLGKYTMVLMGPVLLWAILWADPKALRTPWPYLGGLIALLVFAPNLGWNAENDWLTIRFQFGHGFATATGRLVDSPLPVPINVPGNTAAPLEGQRSLVEGLAGLGRFLGTQVALWGLLAIPLVVAFARRRGAAAMKRPALTDRAAWAVLVAGSLFPFLFFALVATRSDVEANWSAMYLPTAAPLAALAMYRLRRTVLVAAAGNYLLASLYVLHGATGILPLPDDQNRILREMHGYAELAQRLAALPGPLFTDRYQFTAMLRFYEPSLQASQWPGISRPSEYLRGTIAPPVTEERIAQAGGFHLLSRRYVPPDIPGYRLRAQSSIFICTRRELVEVAPGVPAPCSDPLHRWQLFAYASEPGS